jgi:hypothetical protein
MDRMMMGDVELFDDLGSISRETRELGAWCLVRWHEGKICGPLSSLRGDSIGRHILSGLGFPRGHIGMIARFDTRDEAERVAHVPNGTRTAIDVPTRVDELRFSVFVYRYYDGRKLTLRQDVEYEEARLICDAATGRAVSISEHGYKVWIDNTAFLGTPPPRQLPAPDGPHETILVVR